MTTSTPAPIGGGAVEEREDLVAVTLRVGKEFRDELARVRDLASHAVPSGKAEDVLLHVMRAYRKQKERRRFGSARCKSTGERGLEPTGPQPCPSEKIPTQSDRYIPVSVRREVYDREQGTCAYVGPEGRRCGSTWQLEVQHIVPFARGGQPTPHALTIYCRSHNVLQAEKDFGAAHVAARIRERRARPRVAADVGAALKNLGFGARQAEQAALQALAQVPPGADFTTLLREGLRVLCGPSYVAPA